MGDYIFMAISFHCREKTIRKISSMRQILMFKQRTVTLPSIYVGDSSCKPNRIFGAEAIFF